MNDDISISRVVGPLNFFDRAASTGNALLSACVPDTTVIKGVCDEK